MPAEAEENRSLVLVIDDDADYGCLLRLALKEAQVTNVEVIHGGREAIQYLYRTILTGPSPAAPTEFRPSTWHEHPEVALVLLDLRMPGIGGIEVLNWIRAEPRLASIPVVVFSGSEGGEQWSQAREAGANEVRVKPFTYRDLVVEAESLRAHYLAPTEIRYAA